MKAIVKNAMAFLFVFMDNTIRELREIIEKLHWLYWDNRNNGKYWTYLSFACNLIYMVVAEVEKDS